MKTKLNWKPIRRGAVYCSSACGGGCTHAKYQAVLKHGKRMRKIMNCPKDWRISVHENLGWFVTLEHIPTNGLLTVSPDYCNEPEYHAMFSISSPRSGDCRWTDHKRHVLPQKAVDHTLKLARRMINKEVKVLALIDQIERR